MYCISFPVSFTSIHEDRYVYMYLFIKLDYSIRFCFLSWSLLYFTYNIRHHLIQYNHPNIYFFYHVHKLCHNQEKQSVISVLRSYPPTIILECSGNLPLKATTFTLLGNILIMYVPHIQFEWSSD